MASELKPETVRKKELAMESLPDFLARMTLVWEARQQRLATALERAAAAAVRSLHKAKAADPEGVRERRRAAVKRYAARHPERVQAKERKRREAVAAQRAVERDAKRVSRAEGYPKHQATPPARRVQLHAPGAGPADPLSRAWFGPEGAQAARLEGSSSPAL